MIKIAYTYRRPGGRYQYRRKIPLRNLEVLHITWSLRTSEWSVARLRAAAATAALDRVMQIMGHHGFVGVRSASEVKQLIKGTIDLTLGIATQGYFDPTASAQDIEACCLVNADFHDLAALHGGFAALTEADEERLREQGRDDQHIQHVRRLVLSAGGERVLSDASVRMRLEYIGMRPLPGTISQDRLLIHRAISEGQRRAALFHDARVVASGDPLDFLMTQGGVLTAMAQAPRDTPSTSAAEVPPQAPTAVRAEDTSSSPLLSKLIDPIVDNLVESGRWSAGTGEDVRRLMRQFIWIVGDRPCLQYTQIDVAAFRKALWDMPKTVRVQSVWKTPYASAKTAFPPRTAKNKRSNKTMNKDLSYISTFTQAMVAEGHWPEKFIKPLALSVEVTAQQKSSGRVPWKPAHIQTLFGSPIYHGNAGSKRRLVPGTDVFHDAAYWMPLLGAYQLGRRDEHAGHLTSDFVFDQGTPHMLIAPNNLRNLKTADSERVLPIHPRLLELGLQEFILAAIDRGEKFLFPELWQNASKKGGDQYYAIGWRKLIDWLREQPNVVIPTTESGKEADFHSIRSTGLSQLDRSDINQNIVSDLAGHRREGTTARSYQNLLESGGLEDLLQERLKVLTRLPDYAARVERRPLNVMHIKVRTR